MCLSWFNYNSIPWLKGNLASAEKMFWTLEIPFKTGFTVLANQNGQYFLSEISMCSMGKVDVLSSNEGKATRLVGRSGWLLPLYYSFKDTLSYSMPTASVKIVQMLCWCFQLSQYTLLGLCKCLTFSLLVNIRWYIFWHILEKWYSYVFSEMKQKYATTRHLHLLLQLIAVMRNIFG
jgi:hypothetical protein